MDDLLKKFLETILIDSLWIFSFFIMFIEGIMIMHLIYKKKRKINKIIKIKFIGKFMPLTIGVLFTGLIFMIQNFNVIINSEMTLKIMHDKILSSVLISCSIISLISLIILPIRERKRVKKEGK